MQAGVPGGRPVQRGGVHPSGTRRHVQGVRRSACRCERRAVEETLWTCGRPDDAAGWRAPRRSRLSDVERSRCLRHGPAGSAPSTTILRGPGRCARPPRACARAASRVCKDNAHCLGRTAFRCIVACSGRPRFELAQYGYPPMNEAPGRRVKRKGHRTSLADRRFKTSRLGFVVARLPRPRQPSS